MGLTDKLMQVVNGARKLRRSRDPDSYARYERDQDSERKQADHDRHVQEDLAERHSREGASARMTSRSATPLNTNKHVERERAKRADSS